GNTIVLDRNGIVIDSTPEIYPVGQMLPDTKLLATIASQREGTSIIQKSDRTKWLASYTRAGSEEDPDALTLIYQYPAKVLLAEINHTFWLSIIATLILMMLALALGWVGLQSFVGK